ncbi:uncharacterized protein DNG_02003 [Cephalotrichum gorgonifer]|uniref:Uncharacterized protein n=1 Tax=Cephalotrichum gorgonifer TaxID=2041049 RepID=A0AAE8MUE4_9PEZI|nr:uncharacterized protein DNG_02003 [Cephalotrichum gorgonifer]
MNTARSFWLGWGSLSGGGAYYFAKKSINADRAANIEQVRRKKAMQEELVRSEALANSNGTNEPPRTDAVASPSQESSQDPAPTRHAPENESQRVYEKSKYEASKPYVSRKGDRFA